MIELRHDSLVFTFPEVHKALESTPELEKLKSVSQIGGERGDKPLPENASASTEKIITIHAKLRPGQVREGDF